MSLFIFLVLAVSSFAVDSWRNFSIPYPIHDATPFGSGILLATDGGIRYRTPDGDYVFHSEHGLETSAFYLVTNSHLGTFAVSEYGLIAALREDGSTWTVLNRSFLNNKSRVIPGVKALMNGVLVIPFEDRMAFFNLPTASSFLTIDRIGSDLLSQAHVTKLAVHGDSLYARLGNKAYVRVMDWENVAHDYQLSNPNSWVEVSDWESITDLADLDKKHVIVDGKILNDGILYRLYRNSLIPDKWDSTSKVKAIVDAPTGKYLIADDVVARYDGSKVQDLTIYPTYRLEEVYELQSMPVGGVAVATVNGELSFTNGFSWMDSWAPLPGFGSWSSSYIAKMKVLSVDGNGYMFFHIWGYGYFVYSGYGAKLEYQILPEDESCLDQIEPNFPVSGGSVPAPDGSGFITTTSSLSGYSLAYFKVNGEVSCISHISKRKVGGPMHIRVDNDGTWVLYVGTRDGTHYATTGGVDVFRFQPPNKTGGVLKDNGSLKSYKSTTSSPVDIAYDDVNDRLWTVSMTGLAYLDESREDLVSPSSVNGLLGAEYSSMETDVHGNIWLGTTSQGAYRLSYKNKSPDTLSTSHFTTKQGLLSNNVLDMTIDPIQGKIWFAHEKGISSYARNDLKMTKYNMTDSSMVDVIAYPIPFRPRVHKMFVIDRIAENAVVSIYNRGGALVRSFRNEEIIGGRLEWNGQEKSGKLVAPGVYYYVVKNSSKTVRGKFIIVH